MAIFQLGNSFPADGEESSVFFESPNPGINSSEKSRSNIRVTAKGFTPSIVWELRTKPRLLQRPVSTSYAYKIQVSREYLTTGWIFNRYLGKVTQKKCCTTVVLNWV